VGRARLRESLAVPASVPSVPQTAEELNDLRKRLREQAAADVEKAFLVEALRRNDYNVTKASAQTGMQRSNFQSLLKKHNLRIKDIAAREG
jgi:two-component system response regulator PilR (NtrC family)